MALPNQYIKKILILLVCLNMIHWLNAQSSYTTMSRAYNVSQPGASDGSILLNTQTSPFPEYNWSTGDTTPSLYNLPIGNYFVTITDTSLTTTVDTFTIGTTYSNYHFPWQVNSTTSTHSIQIPGNPNILINGLSPQAGDLIGVFYDSLNDWACAGYIVWNGLPQTLTAYGDTSGNAGLENGEAFRFLIRSQLYDMDFIPDVIFDNSGLYNDSGLFNPMGSSGITGMICSDTILHSMKLHKGFNEFSLPFAFIDSTVETVFYNQNAYYPLGSLWTLNNELQNLWWPFYSMNSIPSIVTNAVYTAEMLETDVFQNIAVAQDSITVFISENSCYNSNDGLITVTASYGIPPYGYLWSNGQAGPTITDIQYSEAYSVTISDSQGTLLIREFFTDSLNTIPDLDFTLTPPTGLNADGIIDVSISGFEPGLFSYNWSTGSTDSILQNIPWGTYGLIVYNGRGCSFDTTVYLNLSSVSINVNTSDAQDGLNNGAANAVISYGNPPYDYFWSTGVSGTSFINNLAPGNYSLTVSDNFGYSDSTTFTIYEWQVLSWATTLTNTNHTVIVPLNACFNIVGSYINNGDKIGAFYNNGSGLTCAGYATWNGSATAVNVWGDDPGTTTIDGYTQGEEFNWYVLKASTGHAYNLNALYDTTFSSTAYYTSNGLSSIHSLGFYNSTVPMYWVNTNPASCHGSADGTATIDLLHGTAPYAYLFSDGVTSEVNSGLTSGIYSINVTDALNNSNSLFFFIDQPDSLFVDTAIVTGVTPGYWANGSVQLHISGGIQPYSVLGIGIAGTYYSNTVTLNNLPSNNYNISILDGHGCSIEHQLQVDTSMTGQIYHTEVISEITCNNLCDAEVEIEVYGGVAPYHYSWSNLGNTADLDSLCAGVYDLTITDSADSLVWDYSPTGTSHIITLQNQPDILGQSLNNGDLIGIFFNDYGNLKCGGYSIFNGALPTLTAWGNDSITTYKDGFNTGEAFTFIVRQNASGNLFSMTANYNVNANLGFFNENDTSLIIQLSDSSLFLPTQSVITTSINIDDYQLNVDTLITPVNIQVINSGAIDLMVSGGAPPYLFNWSNGATSEDIDSLISGFYHVTITDVNDCPYYNSYFIASHALMPLNVTPTITDPVSTSSCDGLIDLSVSGSFPPYNFIWSNGDTSITSDSLCTGTYDLTVSSTSVDINMPWNYPITDSTSSVPYIKTNFNLVAVNNGFADIGDYIGAFYLDNGNYHCGGYHKVTATGDFNIAVFPDDLATPQKDGFVATDTVYWKLWRIGDGSIIDLNLQSSNTINFDGYNYFSSGSSLGSFSGNYIAPSWYPAQISATFLLGAQCDSTPITTTIIPADSISGATGSIHVEVWGGNQPFSYQWSNGQTSSGILGLSAGTYTVSIHDIQYCVDTVLSFTLPHGLLSPLNANADVISTKCTGSCDGAIDLVVSGGLTPHSYQWSTGDTTQTLANLCAGNYVVTITNSINVNTMPWQYIATTANPVEYFEVTTAHTDIFINGVNATTEDYLGAFYRDASGFAYCAGYMQLDGSATLKIYPDDTTTLIKDGFYANEEITYRLWNATDGSVIDLNVINFTGTGCVNLFCANTTNGLYFSGFYTPPFWSPSQMVMNFEVTEPSALTSSMIIQNVDPVIGNDGSINLSVSGGNVPYSYSWSNGISNQDNVNLSYGAYYVTIIDANSCVHEDSTFIDFAYAPPPLSGSASQINNLCFGDCTGSIDLTTTGGAVPYEHLWSNGSTNSDISGLCAGSYTVTISSFNHDTTYVNVQILEEDEILPNAAISGVDPMIGNDGSIDITPTGGIAPYTFTWSNGASTEDLLGLEIGHYTVTITDALNCSSVTVTQVGYAYPPAPLNISSNLTHNLCVDDCGGIIDISVSGGAIPYAFEWSTGGISEDINGLCASTYYVTVTSDNNDTLIWFTEILAPDSISAEFQVLPADPNNSNAGVIDLTASGGTPPYTFLWSDSSNFEDISNANYGTYEVSITDANLCIGTASVFVDYLVLPPWHLGLSNIGHRIHIPSGAFLQVNGATFAENGFVGVFYDSAGTLACGGYTVWTGDSTSFVAHWDDQLTSTVDGFTTGQIFLWRMWNPVNETTYDAIATYNQSYQDQEHFAPDGISSVDTIQTISLSGAVVNLDQLSIPSGKVVLYQQKAEYMKATNSGTITNGSYTIEGLFPGDYLIFAVPEPNKNYGIPAYFVHNEQWQNAYTLNIQGHTGNANITLANTISYNTGNGNISGNIIVGSDQGYNPRVFDKEWFPLTNKTNGGAARNIPVILYNEENTALDFQLSNELGDFNFADLAMGTYYIRVEKAGLHADSLKVVLSEANPEYSTNFILNQGAVVLSNNNLVANGLNIYPNPVKDQLLIKLNDFLEESYQAKLYTIDGKLLEAKTINQQNKASIRWDLSRLHTGIYLLKITNDNHTYIHKIMKN